ncbi:Protein kinase, putative, partial [Hondaea fermentalgiana]
HIFNDLIVATTYAGESLHESLLTDDIRAKALAALTAVHEAGVAHRDVLLRNFVMDATGAVRIIDFAQAKTNASHRDFQKDRDAFRSVFSISDSRGRHRD